MGVYFARLEFGIVLNRRKKCGHGVGALLDAIDPFFVLFARFVIGPMSCTVNWSKKCSRIAFATMGRASSNADFSSIKIELKVFFVIHKWPHLT
ncbi:hypothetical protein KCTCHS21_03840 [Cohnella abietis]|uniref:Uncharacterized protein n=1 Tax=Cohnella abietis TaxID=2507935 RepID=A0A3T1CZ05_9BACL|nr:hypothetical protein KCTCHS21_03840 [Cohnella abietis]